MSTFTCPVVRVESVEDHFNADRLSIVKLEGLGFTCVSARLADGSPRYKVGDWVVYIPSDSVLPEWLLREMGFWNEDTGKGMLAGANGDRVKPLKLRGIFSEGVLFPTEDMCKHAHAANGDALVYWKGMDASGVMGITKYIPPIPVHMAGEVANLYGLTVSYDFERIERVPDMFTPGERVIASEKLHGSYVCFGLVPELHHTEMFGAHGDILVYSKGLGAQGLVFKNNEANSHNLYVKMLKYLMENYDLETKLRDVSVLYGGQPVYVMGEIFGKSVQDLHYGTTQPEFRMFEIRVGYEYLPRDSFGFGHLDSQTPHGGTLGLPVTPILYEGPFDLTALEAVRDGKTMVGGDNIREGIVVRASPERHHDVHGRKVAKMISPLYLLRKSAKGADVTEYQ
jgi:RNA ligase (TIGR02306 family)